MGEYIDDILQLIRCFAPDGTIDAYVASLLRSGALAGVLRGWMEDYRLIVLVEGVGYGIRRLPFSIIFYRFLSFSFFFLYGMVAMEV